MNDKDNLNDKDWKNFIEVYQIYRDHIKHEDTLGNQRINILIASQSFLFIAFFRVLGKYADCKNENLFILCILLILICILGISINELIKPAIQAFRKAREKRVEQWEIFLKEKHLENTNNIIEYKYNEKTINIPDIRYEVGDDLKTDLNKGFNKIYNWFTHLWILLIIIAIVSALIISFYCNKLN